mmetsp:Transcript_22190/g.74656  ORF Transcript_22190/g.74656 Transcript_22190/m.74656 type:complete len:332 (+) Transcript_22190:210-1205(+)
MRGPRVGRSLSPGPGPPEDRSKLGPWARPSRQGPQAQPRASPGTLVPNREAGLEHSAGPVPAADEHEVPVGPGEDHLLQVEKEGLLPGLVHEEGREGLARDPAVLELGEDEAPVARDDGAACVAVILRGGLLAADHRGEVVRQHGRLGAHRRGGLGRGQVAAVPDGPHVPVPHVPEGPLVHLDVARRVGQRGLLDEPGGVHHGGHVEHVVVLLDALAPRELEGGHLARPVHLHEVVLYGGVHVALLRHRLQRGPVAVDGKELWRARAELDAHLLAHLLGAPPVVGEPHDLLRGPAALDPGLGLREEHVPTPHGFYFLNILKNQRRVAVVVD